VLALSSNLNAAKKKKKTKKTFMYEGYWPCKHFLPTCKLSYDFVFSHVEVFYFASMWSSYQSFIAFGV
jgi:hypothetical protein